MKSKREERRRGELFLSLYAVAYLVMQSMML